MVRSVLAVGPNPALQRVLAFDQLALGGVNRASALTTYVGGKGQGAALAARLWAPDEEHAVAQFFTDTFATPSYFTTMISYAIAHASQLVEGVGAGVQWWLKRSSGDEGVDISRFSSRGVRET